MPKPTTIDFKVYPLDQDLSRTWFVEYKLNGKRPKVYGRLSHCHTLKEKLEEVERIKSEVLGSLAAPVTKAFTKSYSETFIKEFEQALADRCIYLRKKSEKTYGSKVTAFLKWYRRNKCPEPNFTMAMDFIKTLQSLNRSNTTINAYRNTLKTIFGDLLKRKQIDQNPFAETRKLREHRKSYRYFNEAMQKDLEDFISNCHPQLWMACLFQYYLLLRPDELRTIKCEAFDLAGSCVRILGSDSKNNYTQFITIPDAFIRKLQFIKEYPPHFYVFGSTGKPGLVPRSKKYFPSYHQDMLKRLHYDTHNYKFYSWKHTGAVMYYLKTGDIKGLKEQGRWHSLDMVNEYLKNLGVLDIERVKRDFPAIGEIKKPLFINNI